MKIIKIAIFHLASGTYWTSGMVLQENKKTWLWNVYSFETETLLPKAFDFTNWETEMNPSNTAVPENQYFLTF